jgi:hypothetical protein
VIKGHSDTWLTVEEFAAMSGREEKTIQNWVSAGRMQFVHLCGVPLISMTMVENLITGTAPSGAADGTVALRLANRMDRNRRRLAPKAANP